MESWDRGILTNLERRTPFGRILMILIWVILAVLSITVLFPFIFAFTSGLKSSSEIYKGGLQLFPVIPQWTTYTDVWQKYNFIHLFANSLIIVIGGLIF